MITDATSAANAAAPAAATKSQKSAAATAADFENFLSLLTAQLRNQDPLSPLDSTQFVQQLASFSAVEQQIETNSLLEKLVGGDNTSLSGATSWIGKEVEAESESTPYAGDPLQFTIPTRSNETPTEIAVRNSTGAVIYSKEVAAGQTSFTWNGVDSAGDAAPLGNYKITVDFTDSKGAVSETAPLLTTSRVTEARLVDGAMRLVLENGAVVDPTTITAVRVADDQTS